MCRAEQEASEGERGTTNGTGIRDPEPTKENHFIFQTRGNRQFQKVS